MTQHLGIKSKSHFNSEQADFTFGTSFGKTQERSCTELRRKEGCSVCALPGGREKLHTFSFLASSWTAGNLEERWDGFSLFLLTFAESRNSGNLHEPAAKVQQERRESISPCYPSAETYDFPKFSSCQGEFREGIFVWDKGTYHVEGAVEVGYICRSVCLLCKHVQFSLPEIVSWPKQD